MNKMLCNRFPFFSLSVQYGQWARMCKTQKEAGRFPQLSSLISTLELKGPVPGGAPFSYNCPVTSFPSFVKCHYSPLTTLAPVGSAPYLALYRFPSCIIFDMTTHYIFLYGQSLILTINSMEIGIIVHCVYFCVLRPWSVLRR